MMEIIISENDDNDGQPLSRIGEGANFLPINVRL